MSLSDLTTTRPAPPTNGDASAPAEVRQEPRVIAPVERSPAAVTRTVSSGDGAQRAPDHRRTTHRVFRYALLLGLPVIVIGALTIWWQRGRTPPITYVTAPVTRGAVAPAVTASGTVNPLLLIQVGTYVSGPIIQLYCDYNSKVIKGQLCAKIDPRSYQTTLDQEQANLATAIAQLSKDSANLAYAKLSYDRTTSLVQHDYVTQDSADRAKNVYDQALAQLRVDHASIALHEAALGAAQINLGYTNIVSPVSGTVISRNVTMGQTVAASFQTPTLFVIATDLTKMEVDANVSESDIGGITVGDKAAFTVEAFPDRRFEGAVIQVRQSPQSVQNVVTYDVVIGVANPQLLLKPGMTANCQIMTAHRDSVLRVPDAALRYAPSGLAGARKTNPKGRAQLWLLRSGTRVAMPVETGLDDGTNTEIVQGDVKVGDLVITAEGRPKGAATPGPRLFGL